MCDCRETHINPRRGARRVHFKDLMRSDVQVNRGGCAGHVLNTNLDDIFFMLGLDRVPRKPLISFEDVSKDVKIEK